MALQRDTYYPGRYSTGNAAHPQGAFKNRTTPTSQNGSYLEKDWLNDWDGFFASLLNKAGLTPNNNVDAVGASQYYSALHDVISRGDYVTAGGTANAITLTHPTPVTSYKDGQVFRFKVTAANTGATTINVDGLGVKTLYGLAGLACQGGETAANGYCIAVYSTALAACVLLICTGGRLQVPNATQTRHVVAAGQPATETLGGASIVATQVEVEAGTNTSKTVTPEKLRFGVSMSLGSTGYIALPSWLGGFIMQWGFTSSIPSGTNTAITLPVTFPNGIWRIIATLENTSGDLAVGSSAAPQIRAYTASSITLRNLLSTSAQFSYFCLGR